VARLGGDEFAILLEAIGEADARQFADRLTATLQPGVDLGGTLVSARASTGIALHEWNSPDDPGTLLRKADLAMYAAKRQDKGGYRVFADEIELEFTQRVELEAELRRAVVNDEFHLHYQPIVALSTGEITGFEALLRWNRQQRSPMGPDRFIPVLESSGLITQVGEWVLREACQQAAAWQLETGRAVSVSVNVSPPQLSAPDFVDLVIATLRQTKLPPATLTLEITEGVMVADVEQVIAKLHQLRDLGIRMAIDDFGTGYSSLRYLQTLPVDTVKIDRSFIAKIQEGREQAALARAIVGVGHALNLAVVAEGVETGEHVRLLRGIGCEYGQGYHFAKPQDPGVVRAMLLSGQPARSRPA
jgi:predicted signal transduction protein with EAL and GGDEF domain